jgi:hypothetical protein
VHAGGVIGCALTLVLSAGAAQADIYVYRDAGGTMHFSDYPKHAGFKQDIRSERGRATPRTRVVAR